MEKDYYEELLFAKNPFLSRDYLCGAYDIYERNKIKGIKKTMCHHMSEIFYGFLSTIRN